MKEQATEQDKAQENHPEEHEEEPNVMQLNIYIAPYHTSTPHSALAKTTM